MNAIARSLPSFSSFDDEVPSWVPDLRRSLDGRWGLVFSHADDFAADAFEVDRWLAHVRAAFEGTEIRPIALAGEAYGGGSTWIAKLGGLTIHACVDEIRRSALAYDQLTDAHAASCLQSGHRHVLLLDDAGRLRWSFQYDPGATLPSPIELVAFADAKRCEQRIQRRRSAPNVSRLDRTVRPRVTVGLFQ